MNGGATLRLSEGSGVEIKILSFIGDARWFIGTIGVNHDPFSISPTFQVSDISNQLKDDKFIQKNYSDLTFHENSATYAKSNPEQVIANLHHYSSTFYSDDKKYSLGGDYLTSIPDSPSYWDFLRNRPAIDFISIYAHLSLFRTTSHKEDPAWRCLSDKSRTHRIELIRIIEVWHQELSKFKTNDLFNKLSCSTNQTRHAVSGILGNWLPNKKELARKNSDYWTFDVPKLLVNYKLTPLSTTAIKEFKQRGQSFKKRYEI